MADLKPITFWPAQRFFFEAGPQPTLFLGGVGSGKSWSLALKMIYLLDEYPGSRGLIARQRFQQLKKTLSATIAKLLPKDRIAKMNANEGTMTLTNGSQLLLMHLDSTDSLSNLKSLEINFGAIDQAEDISAEAFDTLYERIGRWSGASKRGGWPKDWPYRNRLGECIPPRFFFSNAYSPGYEHFLTSRFWEHGTERERYKAEGYQVFVGSTRDNLALSDEYIQSRLAMGDEYVRRFVDAVDWGAKEGRIFDLHASSILEPTADLLARIKRTMRLHRVLDHGEAAPTACMWYATDNEDNVYFYREYGAAERLVSEHRAAIYEMSKPDGPNGTEPPSYYTQYADPSIFNKSRGRSLNAAPTWAVSDEYSDRRIVDARTAISWRPANNDEAMTVNRVREYLRRDNTHRHPVTGKLGAPRVYFIRRTAEYPHGCHEILTDIRAAKRVEVGTMPDGSKMFGDERDPKVSDHYLDTLRYAIGMRPSRGLTASLPPPAPGTIRFSDYEKLMDSDALRKRIDARREFRGSYDNGY